MFNLVNEWKVSGEVYNINELNGEFGASIRVRGIAHRPNTCSSSVMEFLCLILPELYADAQRKGLRKYIKANLSGHMESWDRGKGSKVYFICDNVDLIRE